MQFILYVCAKIAKHYLFMPRKAMSEGYLKRIQTEIKGSVREKFMDEVAKQGEKEAVVLRQILTQWAEKKQ